MGVFEFRPKTTFTSTSLNYSDLKKNVSMLVEVFFFLNSPQSHTPQHLGEATVQLQSYICPTHAPLGQLLLKSTSTIPVEVFPGSRLVLLLKV